MPPRRVGVLTHNLLQLLKAVALPPEYKSARPKRLRFAVFSHIGQVVHHGRGLLMRLSTAVLEGLVGLAGCGKRGVQSRWVGIAGGLGVSPRYNLLPLPGQSLP